MVSNYSERRRRTSK